MATVTMDGSTMIVEFSYNPVLVNELKTKISYTDRRWDPTRKAWLVDQKHAHFISDLIEKHLGEKVMIQQAMIAQTAVAMKTLEVKYVGTAKPRDDGNSAFGWANGEWSVIFPESVLREWFEGIPNLKQPSEKNTLYSVLMIQRTATADEIKVSYRRLARQWHPDICREPNAAEQFMAIQNAYELLSNHKSRARYDAGLALEATLDPRLKPSYVAMPANGYRTPLRCGLILAEGRSVLGRFVVSKILAWEDIVNRAGQVLVTSWPFGSDRFVESWV